MRYRSKILLSMLAATVMAATGCGKSSPLASTAADNNLTTLTNTLVVNQSLIWGNHTIPVCFEQDDPGVDPSLHAQVQNGAHVWEQAAGISFVGWGPCNGAAPGVQVKLGAIQQPAIGWSNVGTESQGQQPSLTLSPSVTPQELSWVATHEFGHALGFLHEQVRTDTPDTCNPGDARTQAEGGNIVYVGNAYDNNSVMTYCNDWAHHGVLSATDAAGVQEYYGPPASNTATTSTTSPASNATQPSSTNNSTTTATTAKPATSTTSTATNTTTPATTTTPTSAAAPTTTVTPASTAAPTTTVTPTATTSTSATCSDSPSAQGRCGTWASGGQCETNPAYMLTNCCASCKQAFCTDQSPQCQQLAANGQCASNPDVMHLQCCGSCATYDPQDQPPISQCVDKQQSCSSWAQSGQCEQDPGYMLLECCGSCQGH